MADTLDKSKVNVTVELGPVTSILLVQLMLIWLKAFQHLDWPWAFILIPLWIIALIISGSIVIGFVYWVTSNFLLGRKRKI